MAKNNDKRAERMARSNRNVNRAITVLMAGVIAEFYLLMVNNYYVKGGVGQVLTMMTVLQVIDYIGCALFGAGLVVWLMRKKWTRFAPAAPWLLCIGFFFAVSSILMLKVYPQGTTMMCVIVPVVMLIGIVFLLYGLVPGFVKVAGWAELLCVNVLGMPFNSGVIVYFFVVIACITWGIYETYKQDNINRLRFSFLISVILVGLPFISSKIFIGILISLVLAFFLFYKKELPIRLLNMILVSVLVIFIGYSSYAIIVIRSSANTPMDQNSPEDIFALGSYLNREQYGDRPLFYGPVSYTHLTLPTN